MINKIFMADWLTIVGVILVFLILISPIIAIILEEVFAHKKEKESVRKVEQSGF